MTEQKPDIPESSSADSPEPITPKAPTRKRRRWRAIALGLIILFSGFLIGVCSSAVFFKRMVHMIQTPGEASKRITKRMKWKLGLNPEQTRQVQAILVEREKALITIVRDVSPRLRKELVRTREEVAAVLDPEQREEWLERFDEMQQRWIPAMERIGGSPGKSHWR